MFRFKKLVNYNNINKIDFICKTVQSPVGYGNASLAKAILRLNLHSYVYIHVVYKYAYLFKFYDIYISKELVLHIYSTDLVLHIYSTTFT